MPTWFGKQVEHFQCHGHNENFKRSHEVNCILKNRSDEGIYWEKYKARWKVDFLSIIRKHNRVCLAKYQQIVGLGIQWN
jgi:hypothetical protein